MAGKIQWHSTEDEATSWLRLGGLVLAVVLCCAGLAGAVSAGVQLSFASLADWREKSFKGRTVYNVVTSNGKVVLEARAAGTASGLYRQLKVSVAEMPLLSWAWKVERTLAAENPYRKDGDDYAARVYVVFPGRFFWQTRALVYVWSDKLPVGTMLPSPFTDNAVIIAVESGNRFAGSWRHESRNYLADYRAAFHRVPPDPSAVAVMTDGDNTGSEAVAWYGDISFLPAVAPKGE